MSTVVQCTAGVSLAILVIATWIGFTDIKDPKDPMNKLNGWIKNVFKWRWLYSRYILTKILLIVGFCLGILSIALS